MLYPKEKERIIKKFQTHDGDTGSTQVQIAILSEEVKKLGDHLRIHNKDHSSRLGLLKKIGERRRLLRYLEREDEKAFEDLVKKLRLKVSKRIDRRREALLEKEEEASSLLENNEAVVSEGTSS